MRRSDFLRPSRCLRSPSASGTSVVPIRSLRAVQGHILRTAWGFSGDGPPASQLSHRGVARISRVPGQPLGTCSALRLRWPPHPTTRCVGCCLPRLSRRRLHEFCLSKLNHAACTLPVYASPRRSPAAAQHSVPAGGQPWPGGTLTRGVALRVSDVLLVSLLSRLGPAHDR
jgi:hypothetical protein